ncbi:MAG: Pr6Pr family membrane protein [Bacillota bacterium]|nr:Pr6Pr family membrane protein [Bacillota bacterium]
MKISRKGFNDYFRLFFGVLGLMGIMFMLINGTIGKAGMDLLWTVENCFSMFTTQSNAMVSILFIMLFLYRDKEKPAFLQAHVKGAVTLYITVTGIIFNLFLRNLIHPQGVDVYSNLILHYIMPAAAIADWIFGYNKGDFRWKYALYWLSYPVTYLIFTLIRGRFTTFYPYPFINAANLGYLGVIRNSILLSIFFILLGMIYIIINKVTVKIIYEKSTESKAMM